MDFPTQRLGEIRGITPEPGEGLLPVGESIGQAALQLLWKQGVVFKGLLGRVAAVYLCISPFGL